MKLAAIYNVWDDWDMLQHSVHNISDLVDGVIVIASNTSNYGEVCKSVTIDNGNDYSGSYGLKYINIILYEPDLKLRPEENERNKRNLGLRVASLEGFTHFLMMDADEFYEHEPFLKEKERFLNPSLNGLVCASQVYFKSPKLTIGLDTTKVTFIHKITPGLRFEFNRNYPFAFDRSAIRIDPTRQLNINNGVEWSNIIMHHYSWVREDYEKKIRNSTARANLERSLIRQDLALAKEGEMCKFYGKTLIRASVDFNIPDFNVDEDLQSIPAGNS